MVFNYELLDRSKGLRIRALKYVSFGSFSVDFGQRDHAVTIAALDDRIQRNHRDVEFFECAGPYADAISGGLHA